jgi:hypothetical protein
MLECFYDDYKRSEGYSDVKGVKRDKNDAYKTILRIEFFRNTEDGEKEPKKYEEFFRLLDSLKNVTDNFLNKWEEVREEYLGKPEFCSMLSTGYRYKV